jgi:hypothetical protein
MPDQKKHHQEAAALKLNQRKRHCILTINTFAQEPLHLQTSF